MNAKLPTECLRCGSTKFFACSAGIRCANPECLAFAVERDRVNGSERSNGGACPKCGKLSWWISNAGRRCNSCGFTEPAEAAGLTHAPVAAVRIKDVEPAGPSHAITFGRVSGTI